MYFKDITADILRNKIKHNKIMIIDIRDEDSYKKENIPNSVNYKSADIMRLIEKKDKNLNILIYCYRGNSSRKVASFLSESGFDNIFNLIGGFNAWKDSSSKSKNYRSKS